MEIHSVSEKLNYFIHFNLKLYFQHVEVINSIDAYAILVREKRLENEFILLIKLVLATFLIQINSIFLRLAVQVCVSSPILVDQNIAKYVVKFRFVYFLNVHCTDFQNLIFNSNSNSIIFEYLFHIIPYMLLYTKYYDSLNIVLLFFATSTSMLILFILYEHSNRPIVRIFRFIKQIDLVKEETTYIIDCVLQTFMYNIYLCASICILAVDFNLFPVQFKKNEKQGISVMDLGAAFFIQIFALKSKSMDDNKTIKDLPQLIKIKFKRHILLLCFGLSRLIIFFTTNIPMDSTFGNYWNFFLVAFFVQVRLRIFSNSFISLHFLCFFLQLLSCPFLIFIKNSIKRALISSILVSILHQSILHTTYLDVNMNETNNIIGITSTIGYLGIFLNTKIISICLERIANKKK